MSKHGSLDMPWCSGPLEDWSNYIDIQKLELYDVHVTVNLEVNANSTRRRKQQTQTCDRSFPGDN